MNGKSDIVARMKMDTINISLPPGISDYVRRSAARNYGNISEFFRDLVRQRMDAEAEADMKFLRRTGTASPGPSDEDLADIKRIKRQVRKKMNARRV